MQQSLILQFVRVNVLIWFDDDMIQMNSFFFIAKHYARCHKD